MLVKNNFNLPTFSLSFLIVGMPIIYILREYLPISKQLFTYSFLFLLLIGLINLKNLFRLQFYNNKPFLYLFIFLINIIIFLIYAYNYDKLFTNVGSIFLILTIFIFMALNSHKDDTFRKLPIYTLYISSITTIVSLTLNSNHWIVAGNRFFVGDTNNPNLSSFVALLNILSIIFYFYTNKTKIADTIILLIISMCSFYIYIISFSKSSILGLVLALSFLLFVNKNFVIKLVRNLIIISIVTYLLLSVLSLEFFTIISNKVTMLGYAFDSYFYGHQGSLSAEIRHDNLTKQIDLLTKIDLFEGNGIYTTRADLPILQVFTDLGIITGLINLISMVIFPIFIIIKVLLNFRNYKKHINYNLYVFCIMIFLFYFPNNLFHGTPYEHTIWIPIIILYKFTPWKKRI